MHALGGENDDSVGVIKPHFRARQESRARLGCVLILLLTLNLNRAHFSF